ncbi:MAG TPA: hypothetical protein VE954_30525 [Oligoflexus sp.]|uniref:hypothetical protein n=1 Tax=Oligoflexus sp. TaxID=1971216 RepID=UPI002D2A9327|nr:hypothetical protein [Oligoflexus sp.]HYX37460.1 hypothetical protein [Oligoflexus sp.]
MRAHSIVVAIIITMMAVACGTERPNPEDYRRTQTGTPDSATKPTDKKTDGKTANTTPSTVTPTPPADADKPATATPPATPPANVAARAIPNAAELTAARAYYTASCTTCHGAFPGAKKGVTDIRLKAAEATVPLAHTNAAVKFPIDTSSNDGVENENLARAALIEAMK